MASKYWIGTLSVLALAGCKTDGGVVDDPADTGLADIATLDTGADIAPDTAVDVEADVPGDTGSPDTLVTDTDRDPVEGLGQTGDLCEDDPECLSEYCLDLVPGEGGGICSQRCTGDDCPEGFACVTLAASGGDDEQVCIPDGICIDIDQDGYGLGDCPALDCDDSDPDISPGADEICDGVDQNCNGRVDENTIDSREDCVSPYPGVCADGRTACVDGLLTCEPHVAPGEEICNGLDDDCDSEVDELPVDGQTVYRDTDDDGHGDPDLAITACEAIPGYVFLGDDCDDGDPAVHPGAAELCDGEDQDCDGELDEDVEDRLFPPDADGDGYGDDGGEGVLACAPPDGYAAVGGDCDDGDPTVRPGVDEVPGDEVDQNCDGAELCFQDLDGDGFWSDDGPTLFSADLDCDDPPEVGDDRPSGDCNDAAETVYPGARELCDGLDNDCDGVIDDGCACPEGTVGCGEVCIPDTDCCTDADCTGDLACRSGACACADGLDLCGVDVCIAPTACCSDDDCDAPMVCDAPGGACVCPAFGTPCPGDPYTCGDPTFIELDAGAVLRMSIGEGVLAAGVNIAGEADRIAIYRGDGGVWTHNEDVAFPTADNPYDMELDVDALMLVAVSNAPTGGGQTLIYGYDPGAGSWGSGMSFGGSSSTADGDVADVGGGTYIVVGDAVSFGTYDESSLTTTTPPDEPSGARDADWGREVATNGPSLLVESRNYTYIYDVTAFGDTLYRGRIAAPGATDRTWRQPLAASGEWAVIYGALYRYAAGDWVRFDEPIPCGIDPDDVGPDMVSFAADLTDVGGDVYYAVASTEGYPGEGTGRVWVWRFDGVDWVEHHTLAGTGRGRFGTDVSVHATELAVTEDGPPGVTAGVYLMGL